MKVMKAQEIIALHFSVAIILLRGNGDLQQQHKRFWLRAIWMVTSKIWSAPEKNI